jgi:hypothetical protein
MTATMHWQEALDGRFFRATNHVVPPMKYRAWLNLIRLTVFGMAMLACSGGCGDGLELAGVRGTVQFDGKPLTNGKVVFASVERGKPAAGQINQDGTYVLSTIRPGDGATPGKHKVTVVTDLEIRGSQRHLTWLGPDQLLLEVEADKENTIDIDIRQNSGWKLAPDD